MIVSAFWKTLLASLLVELNNAVKMDLQGGLGKVPMAYKEKGAHKDQNWGKREY